MWSRLASGAVYSRLTGPGAKEGGGPALDLKAAYARALADVEEADAQQRKAEEALMSARLYAADLRTMVNALERAMELYEQPVLGESQEEAEPPTRTRGTSTTNVAVNKSLSIQDILESGEVPSIVNLSYGGLRHLGRPASTQEVRETIAEIGGRDFNDGKDFNQEQVRNALQWLMKSGRVDRVAPGTWAIPKPVQSQDDFTPADTSAGVSKTSESDPSIQVGALTGADLTPQPAG